VSLERGVQSQNNMKPRHRLLIQASALAALLLGCRATSLPRLDEDFALCSICFSAPKGWLERPDKLLKVDSCAFRLTGHGLAVAAEHSGFVGSFEKSGVGEYRSVELSNRGRRAWNRFPDRFTQTLWFPAEWLYPPLSFQVIYTNPELADTVDEITSTVHRCGKPPREP
jgi:hypothetical protein